eukprot:TRINITY_DN102328_c0_g1_i1.p1 TRINITY_DN102328_c0_g1~~TRINITY_DN102328_c0_g1_i1.p1  ORF type:complete len:430 (-),score=70.44 TRINITY_DN102328_c0_g1_i1:257-1546(-)
MSAMRIFQHTSRLAGNALRPQRALASLSVRPEMLNLTWQDGTQIALNPVWLRERCQDIKSVDPSTLQPKVSPHDLPEVMKVEDAKFQDGQLQVTFSDGHESLFCLDRIHKEVHQFDEAPLQVPTYTKPKPKLWTAKDYVLPKFDHDEVISNPEARLSLLQELIEGGQVLVRNVPRQDGEVVRFARTLSTVRGTDWGDVFNVKTKPDLVGGAKVMKDLAYTPFGIGFHTDNPYRYPTPDYQLLHAIDHCECPEGEHPCSGCTVTNQMVDGFAVAEQLRQEDPEGFRLMCEVPVRFENDAGGQDSALVHVAPHFTLENMFGKTSQAVPKIDSIRYSPKSGQYAPPLDPATLQAFYNARRRFSELLHDANNMISLQFRPGDLLMFNNLRVLHARSSIAPTDGERWLQGCYVDRDGLWLNFEREWRAKFVHAK